MCTRSALIGQLGAFVFQRLLLGGQARQHGLEMIDLLALSVREIPVIIQHAADTIGRGTREQQPHPAHAAGLVGRADLGAQCVEFAGKIVALGVALLLQTRDAFLVFSDVVVERVEVLARGADARLGLGQRIGQIAALIGVGSDLLAHLGDAIAQRDSSARACARARRRRRGRPPGQEWTAQAMPRRARGSTASGDCKTSDGVQVRARPTMQ